MNRTRIIRLLPLLVLLGLVAQSAQGAWDNYDHAQPGGTVLRKGVLVKNSGIGHAGVYLGKEGKHGLSKPIIQANGWDAPSSYVNTGQFLDGNNFWGHYRSPEKHSATKNWRDWVMYYAKEATAKPYIFGCIYRYKGYNLCAAVAPRAVGVPEKFRCDGLAEWANEKADEQYYWRKRPWITKGFMNTNLASFWPGKISSSGKEEILPKLNVTQIEATKNRYTAGDPITVVNRVENTGGGPARTYKVSFVLFPASIFRGEQYSKRIPIASKTRPTIDYNQAQYRENRLALPKNLAPGRYYLGMATSHELNGKTYVVWGRSTKLIAVAALATKPPTPMLMSPSGNTTDSTPTYRWTGSPAATKYRLFVRKGSATVTVLTVAASAAGCSGGSNCAFTPSKTLSSGDYRWWVAAWNTAGWSSWSAPKAFRLGSKVEKPRTPMLMSPSGNITDSTPKYQWMGAPNATHYRLFVRKGSATVIEMTVAASVAGCSGESNCAYTPNKTLSSGSYRWWVAAANDAGWSSWSGSMAFNIGTAKNAGWGALNSVYCKDRSVLTFRVTIDGVKRYSTTRGPETASWEDWVYTNQGYKTVGIAIYGGCANTYTGTIRSVSLGAGEKTRFRLGYDSVKKQFYVGIARYAGASSGAELGVEQRGTKGTFTLDEGIEYRVDVDASGTSGIGVSDSLKLPRLPESRTP